MGRDPETGAPANGDDGRDRLLLARVRERDALAFEQLYRGYYARLYRFALRMLGSSESVDEVVNEAMLVVWQKAASYSGASKVSTWIFGIAYNKARGVAAARATRAADLDEVEIDTELADTDVHWLSRLETSEALEAALRALSAEQRAVVELTYFFGLGYQEIALIAGCPENTVKTRMFHARRRLARQLREQ